MKAFFGELIYVVSLFFSLFIIPDNCFSQLRQDESDLVNCVINSFKSQKDSSILNCLNSKSDLVYIKEIARGSGDTSIPDIEFIYNNLAKGAISNYKLIIEKGKRFSLDWSTIKIDSFKNVKFKPLYNEIERQSTKIYFKSANRSYILTFAVCVKINDEWKLNDKIELREL